MKRTGIIYKVISPSGKVYIGKTVMGLANRKYYHIRSATKLMIDTKFCRAIRKYGAELVWEIIYDGIPYSEIDNLEIQIISKYNSYKVGYNSTKGGMEPLDYTQVQILGRRCPKHTKGLNTRMMQKGRYP